MKKILLSLLITLLVTNLYSSVTQVYADSVELLYNEESPYTPVELTGGDNTAAAKISAKSTFKSIEVFCPSWNNDIGNLTLKLYKWNSNYYTTIASEPIAQDTFVNFQDNSWLTLTFDSQQPGYYLWVLGDAGETVGVWRHLNGTGLNVSYFNGEEITGDYKSRIYYDGLNSETPPTNPNNDGVKVCGYIKCDNFNSNEGFKVEIPEIKTSIETRDSGYFEIYNVPRSTEIRTIIITKESCLKRTISDITISGDIQLSYENMPIKILAGDIVQDNFINMIDVMEIVKSLNALDEAKYDKKCDLNMNGVTNIEDILVIAKNFSKSSADYK